MFKIELLKDVKNATNCINLRERLRINLKFTNTEITDGIKWEFNLIVIKEQCTKAKSKLYRKRKANYKNTLLSLALSSRNCEMESIFYGDDWYYSTNNINKQTKVWSNICLCTSLRATWKANAYHDGAFLKWNIKGYYLM